MRCTAVIIPTYNEENYILNTLRCFLNQSASNKDFFIVVADNNSKDNTVDIIQEFKKKNPDLAIEITTQPIKGILPTRVHAVQTAISLGCKEILSIDADTLIPHDFISCGKSILKDPHNVLAGRTHWPTRYKLISFIYFKEISILTDRLTRLYRNFFGLDLYGVHMGFSVNLFHQIYLGDLYSPLIPDDDLWISRRLHYLGAKFVKSPNYVVTSDRRCFGDLFGWMSHQHEQDFRQADRGTAHICRPSPREIDQAVKNRINRAAEYLLRYLTDAFFLLQVNSNLYSLAQESIKKVVNEFKIDPKLFRAIHNQNKFAIYKKVCSLYKQIIITNLNSCYVKQS